MIVIELLMFVFLSSFDWNAVPITILERRSRYVKMVRMATRNQRTERRTDALSKERIVEAAIEILDDEGEAALTFRALLRTPGNR